MKKIIGLLTLSITFGACYNRQTDALEYKTEVKVTEKERTRIVNLSETRTSEEGATKFVQFTDETERVYGPQIVYNKGNIEWYAPGFISVSPDGKKIAYLALKDGQSNIYIKNTEGGKQTVQRTFRNSVLDMSFSKDGKFIAFTEQTDSDYNVYQINSTEGTAIQQITTTSNRETSPVYSNDSKMIFFTKSEYQSATSQYKHFVWSYEKATALLTQYTEGFAPDIHPNGRLVALTRNNSETGRGEIWTVDLGTGQSTQVLSDKEMGFSTPKFSPDGKYILCVGSSVETQQRIGNLDIFVIKPDGTGRTQLTFHPGHDCSPVWSPDGKSIYFLSQRGSGSTARFSVWQMDFKIHF